MVRLKVKETKAGDRRHDKRCSICTAMKHSRLDCDECDYSICSSCFSNKQDTFHEHRSFALTAPPGLILTAARGTGTPCCSDPSFGHCGRCYVGTCSIENSNAVLTSSAWKPEEWMVQCRTCLFEFDEIIGLCVPCDAEILSACRQKDHQLVSVKCRQRGKDASGHITREAKVAVECTECTSRTYIPHN